MYEGWSTNQLQYELFVFILCCVFAECQQELILTLSSGEQCFGSRVELLCTHPDPFDDPDKYIQFPIAWAENGTTIDFTNPASARFTLTRLNSTASMLSFDITEEVRDRVILYTCFLAKNNANRDRDESVALLLDPQDKPITPNITSLANSATDRISWSHNPGCYRHHTFMFNLVWTRTGDPPDSPSSGSVVTTATQYDFSSLPRGEYSVSIQAQCMENISIVSDEIRARIYLTHIRNAVSCPSPSSCPVNVLWDTLNTGGLSPGLIVGIVVVCVVILLTFLAGCGVGVIGYVVYQKKSKQLIGSTEVTSDEDKKNSTLPSYVNVESNDGSISMTTNPSYGQVDRKHGCPKPVYGNL